MVMSSVLHARLKHADLHAELLELGHLLPLFVAVKGEAQLSNTANPIKSKWSNEEAVLLQVYLSRCLAPC